MTTHEDGLREALEPCPFCGVAMHLNYEVKTGYFGPDADHKAGCFIGTIDFTDFADEHHAIDLWNRRAALSASPKPMESDFIREIHDRTPRGEWIMVQHHPDGGWSVAHTADPSTSEVERVARAIDPVAWAHRDKDAGRRKEWDEQIRFCWTGVLFEEWVERTVKSSLEKARAAIAAMTALPKQKEASSDPTGSLAWDEWQREHIKRAVIAAIVENSKTGGMAVAAGKAADALLAIARPAQSSDLAEALELATSFFEMFCEGFCEGDISLAKFGGDRCSGCPAAAFVEKHRGGGK